MLKKVVKWQHSRSDHFNFTEKNVFQYFDKKIDCKRNEQKS